MKYTKKDLYKSAKVIKRNLKLKHLISLYNKKELINFIDTFKNKRLKNDNNK